MKKEVSEIQKKRTSYLVTQILSEWVYLRQCGHTGKKPYANTLLYYMFTG